MKDRKRERERERERETERNTRKSYLNYADKCDSRDENMSKKATGRGVRRNVWEVKIENQWGDVERKHCSSLPPPNPFYSFLLLCVGTSARHSHTFHGRVAVRAVGKDNIHILQLQTLQGSLQTCRERVTDSKKVRETQMEGMKIQGYKYFLERAGEAHNNEE